MKRTFTLLILCLLLSLNLSAQEKSRFGLKTGINVAWQSYQPENDLRIPVVSMHFTGFTEVQVTEKLFVQPGLSLQGKGLSTDVNGGLDGSEGKVHMLYLEIPINLLYKLKVPDFGMLVLGGGPYAGLGLMGSKFDGSDNVFRHFEGTMGYGNTDYGLNLSAGAELNSRLTLTLQQSIGLKNVAPEDYLVPAPADGPATRAIIKNRVASLSLGYRF
ncbi:PorT family protein [Flavihumibacter sp. R14]|nr:PorT family protein [Flavihumibacter soli]